MGRGFLNTVASVPGLQLMDAEASHSAYPSCTSMYRRTASLVDINDRNSYLLDIFRVRGGRMHDYSFHGPPFAEFSVSGLNPGPTQEKGTLLGEDIEFGSSEKPEGLGPDNCMMLPLQAAEGLISDDREYRESGTEGWTEYHSDEVLTEKAGAEMRIPLPDLDAESVKLFLQVHNYQEGPNAIEVTVGDTTEEFRWGSEGKEDIWFSGTFEITGAEEIVITAQTIEQSWALISKAGLTTNLEMTEPRFYDPRTSGYQYLFDVRRAHPEQGWSATWRDPEEDLALTMNVPAGSMEEVILTKAEAELKPRHPETLDYVLGRNVVKQGAASELSSDYIVAAEPHQGDPAIQGIERLSPSEASEEAVAVAVQANSFTDYIHSALDRTVPCTWNADGTEFSVTGEYAQVRTNRDGIQSIRAVNCTRVRFGETTLGANAAPSGKVVNLDHDANTITVDTAVEQPDLYRDTVAIIGNEIQQTSYTVKSISVENGKTTLGFDDVLFLVQMGPIEEIQADKSAVKLDKLGRVDGRNHEGRWLYNEDRSVGLRIAETRGDVFVLESGSQDLEKIYKDFDGDGRRTFWISDIGPGDSVRLPSTVLMERSGDHAFRIQTSGDAELTVPKNMAQRSSDDS